ETLVLSVAEEHSFPSLRSAPRAGAARATLTPRELQVLSRLALGDRVHEAAAALSIAEATAHTHIRNAMNKLGARSQAQLIALALAGGQLELEPKRVPQRATA
ncbi:MAG TPA: LuxR C-terminal-related transcriptional regulator, partial [Solirubrobacteraceae bacterium]|nr:LuxR C-terminal-related transcriptional regulator [Solirubrobacteraceae bacterium]